VEAMPAEDKAAAWLYVAVVCCLLLDELNSISLLNFVFEYSASATL
jgi:hypothetical protein